MKRLLLSAVFVACGGTDCEMRTVTVEVVPGSLDHRIREDELARLRGRGYSCDRESIRNAFGATIGWKYTCTGCD